MERRDTATEGDEVIQEVTKIIQKTVALEAELERILEKYDKEVEGRSTAM